MNKFKDKLLNEILEHELSLGNTIKSEETSWSAKDLVIRMCSTLDIDFAKKIVLSAPEQLHVFETNDNHNLKSFGVASTQESIVAQK